jgi:hypothetical protein
MDVTEIVVPVQSALDALEQKNQASTVIDGRQVEPFDFSIIKRIVLENLLAGIQLERRQFLIYAFKHLEYRYTLSNTGYALDMVFYADSSSRVQCHLAKEQHTYQLTYTSITNGSIQRDVYVSC